MAKVSRKLLRELKDLSETPLARLGGGGGEVAPNGGGEEGQPRARVKCSSSTLTATEIAGS